MNLLTPKDVAKRLAVSPRTVYSWIAEGRLPTVQLSERITRIPEDAVDAMVEAALTCETRPADGSVERRFLAAEAPGAYGATALSMSEVLMARLRGARDEILAAAAAERLENVRVFGSVARGDAGPESDVDLLVDLLPRCTLFNLVGFEMVVEEFVGVSVDVISARTLGASAESVLAEARPL